jgi:hypothetical protein
MRHWEEVFSLIGADVEINDSGTGEGGAGGRGQPLFERFSTSSSFITSRVSSQAASSALPTNVSTPSLKTHHAFLRPQATSLSASATCCSLTWWTTWRSCRPSGCR